MGDSLHLPRRPVPVPFPAPPPPPKNTMNPSEMCATLSGAPLFHDFHKSELADFIDLMDPANVEAGECIVRQDELGDQMYILLSGTARVTHHTEGQTIELATLEPGDFFGELALVDHAPRSADVVAMTPCCLLRLSQASLGALAGVYPTSAFKFLIAIGRILAARMRQSNRRYIDSQLFPLGGKD